MNEWKSFRPVVPVFENLTNVDLAYGFRTQFAGVARRITDRLSLFHELRALRVVYVGLSDVPRNRQRERQPAWADLLNAWGR